MWSPAGSRVAFASLHGKSVLNVYQKLASGTAADEILVESPISTNVQDWSRDGRYLLIRQTPPGRGRDILAVLLDTERRITPIAITPFEERDGQFSPDARWVAYSSNESGGYEIYVQNVPRTEGATADLNGGRSSAPLAR